MIFHKNNEIKVNTLRNYIKDEFTFQLFSGKELNNNGLILSEKHISHLFYLYDKYFFTNELKIIFGNKINFSTSNRMTSAGGKTIYTKHKNNESFEIRISLRILNNFYKTSSEKKVSGILVKDPIEALQIILEHEICHIIEFYNYKTSNCKGERFKKLSGDLFNHKSIYHELPTEKRITLSQNHKNNVQVGDFVTFDFKGKEYNGVISNITKRATVMVKDNKGLYKDNNGNRLTKWYVPLNNLAIKESNK